MTEQQKLTFTALQQRLDSLMLRDRLRFSRRLHGVKKVKNPDAQQAIFQEMAKEIDQAAGKVLLREAARPEITYPDNLPVSQKKQDILEAIRDHQVVIVAGETGSGKTTQLPKICMELGRGIKGLIGHTQPRRLAARTVANRIAEELKTEPGGCIGYKVRFSDHVSDNTMVKLMTDGILLAEIQQDRLLMQYDTIIIDEAHERSLNIDFLLGYLKELLPRRPDLKIIITSATIDPERFSRHFNNAPIIEVSGRTYPVEVRYRPIVEEADDTERDQLQAIFDAVDELSQESPGDILIFMSGEREIRDMYGLIPVGQPDQRRLVLPDDWPEDMHPLRKDAMDYRLRPEPTTDTETYPFINEGNSDARVIPVGPLHITSDEPGHFRLFVDGEQIVDADYRLFYVHRGMEKLAETRMGYNEVTFLSDRVCGICGFAHSVAYTNSVENALGIEVPQRAHTIRSILLEVERLHSHLLNLGLSCHFVGFDTGFMQFFRVREKSMTMAELLTGSRKTYGLNLIGGVRRDILKEQRLQTLKLVREMRADVSELVEMLLATPNMEQRTQGIGILDRQIARDYSPVGPLIRGSGFARDLRFDHPYADYGNIPKTLFTFTGGDVFSRVMVRVKETFDSLAMLEFALDNMQDTPLLTEGFSYKPHAFALGFVEAPRGEDVHWSMLGDNQKLFRWRCRAATYANWPVLRYMLRGNTVSDAPLIIGSLDPCYSCTDRVTLVDVRKRQSKTVPYKEIERYGIDRNRSPLK